jgi:hypothetical protein
MGFPGCVGVRFWYIGRTQPDRGRNVEQPEQTPERDGVDYSDGKRKISVSEGAWSRLLATIGGDLRWIVRAIGWGIAFVATCYGVSLLS